MPICGVSSEYEFAKVVAYLEIPVDECFDMNEDERNAYVQEFNKMTIEDATKGKTIVASHVPTVQVSEFKEFSVDVKCYSPLKSGQTVWLPLLGTLGTLDDGECLQQWP